MVSADEIETSRLDIQRQLDDRRPQEERNRLGQFATPTALATDILQCARSLLPTDEPVHFLDPALGTGSFFSALLRVFPSTRIASAEGFEIDPYFGEPAAALWEDTRLTVHIEDFTKAEPRRGAMANLLVCNPPYVRHHHLSAHDKRRLQSQVCSKLRLQVGGLTGLYCYFLLLSDQWMAKDGLAAWLIPSEFMDVNYGRTVKCYLMERVNLIRVHRFDPSRVQFNDALVSSAVVWFRKSAPSSEAVLFTYGGTLQEPAVSRLIPRAVLARAPKWTRLPLGNAAASGHGRATLSDLFTIQRGLATGANEYFVLTADDVQRHQIPPAFLRPILPSPKLLQTSEVHADENGEPVLDHKRFLLSCDLPEAEVQAQHPLLWEYLQKGIDAGIPDRYLCKHRSPWYSQEKRPAAPFLCTYMNRKRGGTDTLFRFILNRSNATAANVYLMLYPKPKLRNLLIDKPHLVEQVWQALNRIHPDALLDEGRVYGGGLHKLEPRELANAPAHEVLAVVPELRADPPNQARLDLDA